MKDDRTPEQKYKAWVDAVNKCLSKGWFNVKDWVFRAPSGSMHDLSAANLDVLDRIEENKSFLVSSLA
jgi:hypothetical protein